MSLPRPTTAIQDSTPKDNTATVAHDDRVFRNAAFCVEPWIRTTFSMCP